MCNCPQYGVMYIHHSAMYIHHVAIHIQHITVAHEHQITQCSKSIYQSCICCICICSFVCCCSYCSFNWCSAIRASINLVFVVFVFVFMCVVAVTGLPIDAVRYAHLSIGAGNVAHKVHFAMIIICWSHSDHSFVISFQPTVSSGKTRQLVKWMSVFFSCLCSFSSMHLSAAANIPDLTDLQIYN